MHIWHPFTQPALDGPPIRITHAEGVYLYTGDGRILDAISSWWVNLHGHGHPRIVSAIQEQVSKLDHVIFAGFTHDAAEELAERLRQVVPGELSQVFFSDNGSTAVEVALKMAVQYWRNRGQGQKKQIVALEHAYHGDTAGAMSVSADSTFNDNFQAMRFPVMRAHSAYCLRCPVGKERESCRIECVETMERLLEERGEDIAAVIVEPLLQGAGGMIVHPVEYLQRIRAACTRHGVLLIADEVLTGFGRCGRMFACQLAGVAPDFLCLSKGLTGGFLPMGATLCTSSIYETFCSEDRGRAFFHGHSYTGNPLSCAAAIANLAIFASEPVFDRIGNIEKIHREWLRKLQNHPSVAGVRMLGSVAALELAVEDPGYLSSLRPELYRYFIQQGVLLRPLGNVIYLIPPYSISSEQLHFVYEVVAGSLDKVTSGGFRADRLRTAARGDNSPNSGILQQN